ncbi:uncharacterized protein [Drosophila bipectinata]|uniref:uncharacterized protein n=1 Tax=Drosophila bipectinata TaxID=42026 RepID=UPI0038B2BAA7
MDCHMDYRGELRQHFFGSKNISRKNSRSYVSKQLTQTHHCGHNQIMDHSKHQEHHKCPHNRGSGLNQGYSPVKTTNFYQSQTYQKLNNDIGPMPGNVRRSCLQMDTTRNRQSRHYTDLPKYEEPNNCSPNNDNRMQQNQKTCQRNHSSRNNISKMKYNLKADYQNSPRFKSDSKPYQYDSNLSRQNGECRAGRDANNKILYKNSAFRIPTSSKSEHADDEDDKDASPIHYSVKACKKGSFNFIDSARAHCQEVNKRYRQPRQLPTVGMDDLVPTPDSSNKDSKKLGPTRNTFHSPKNCDDLRSIVRSQIQIQQVLDHSIRAGISPLNSSPREDTSPNEELLSTARATKGSPVRHHCEPVHNRYQCQKHSNTKNFHHSSSGSSTKNTKPSEVTVISAKSGLDLRKIVRSQIEVQKDLDISMRAGLSKKKTVQTTAQVNQIPFDIGTTFKVPNMSNPINVNKIESQMENSPQASSSIQPLDFTVSADDIVSSKVITPVIQKIQRMYLNTLQDELSIMEYMQKVPKLVSEVYRREAAEKDSKS